MFDSYRSADALSTHRAIRPRTPASTLNQPPREVGPIHHGPFIDPNG